MPKLVHVIVNCCAQCPFLMPDAAYSQVCAHSSFKVDRPIQQEELWDGCPDWCPLPDAEVEKANTSKKKS